MSEELFNLNENELDDELLEAVTGGGAVTGGNTSLSWLTQKFGNDGSNTDNRNTSGISGRQ